MQETKNIVDIIRYLVDKLETYSEESNYNKEFSLENYIKDEWLSDIQNAVMELDTIITAFEQSEQEAQEIIADLKTKNMQFSCPNCGEKLLDATGSQLYEERCNFRDGLISIQDFIKDAINKRPHSNNALLEHINNIAKEVLDGK